MILAPLFLLLSIWIGYQIVRLLPLELRYLETLATSVAIGFSLSAWIVFLFAWILGFKVGLPLAIILLIATCAILPFWLKPRFKLISSPFHTKWRVLATIIGLTTALLVVYLAMLSYQFPGESGAWFSNSNVWGDSPLHVGFITQFAHGNKVDLTLPIFEKASLTYPFIADFYSAILMRLGGNWWMSLTLPTILMLLAMLQLVFSFASRLLRSNLAAWLAYLMFFFSGSLHGALTLGHTLITKGIDAYNIAVGTSITVATGDSVLSFIHSHALPQRSFLFGLPLALAVMMALLSLYRAKETPKTKIPYHTSVIMGILIGLTPLVHVQTFFVLLGLLALAVICIWIERRRLPKELLLTLGVAIVTALPQLIWQVHGSYDARFSRWILGWMMTNFAETPHANWLSFWLSQIGFLFVVVLLGWAWLKRAKAPSEIWFIYLAGVTIFAICNIHVFQPTYWDNMKFFEYAFFFIMLTTAFLFATWSRKLWGKMTVGILMISLCTMGFLTLVVSAPRFSFQLLSADEVKFGEQMSRELPSDAYILVSDRHNHPITMLGDRHVLMSYAGWNNLYSSSWPTVYQDRATMLNGGPEARELIASYGLTHAVFSDSETYSGKAKLKFFEDNYKLVTHTDGWWVFDLKDTP